MTIVFLTNLLVRHSIFISKGVSAPVAEETDQIFFALGVSAAFASLIHVFVNVTILPSFAFLFASFFVDASYFVLGEGVERDVCVVVVRFGDFMRRVRWRGRRRLWMGRRNLI